jgi:signal transduction histidine kinase
MVAAPIARLPVRIRLALWYAASLFLVLLFFGAATFYTVRVTTVADYDRELKLRLQGIESFLQEPTPHTLPAIQHELDEDSELRPGGELLQVSDAAGNWLYQSQSIRRLGIRPPLHERLQPKLATVYARGFPVRLLWATEVIGGRIYNIQLGQSLEQSSKLMNRFGWILIGASPFLLLAAAGAGYWMAKRALQPVIQISADARSITGSDIGRRIKLPVANDELRDLSQTLNEMLSRLEAAFQRIARFTADASHELRTPVAVVRTTAELALAEHSPRLWNEALQSILAESERTTNLLESLLTLARADADARLTLEPVDAIAVAGEAVRQTSLLASGRGVSLHFRPELERAEVRAHQSSLRRLFLIFLDNGLKYTPAGGSVDFRIFAEDHTVVAEIRDTGIGISDADLPHIFERFYRADKARDRSSGVGLGLAIAEWLAKAHEASIEVTSVVGEGTTATLRFPALRLVPQSLSALTMSDKFSASF